MNNFYITADELGTQTGGGIVTWQESHALYDLGGSLTILDANKLGRHIDPFKADQIAEEYLSKENHIHSKIAHIYAGTFTKTVRKLREHGVRVTYTAAAHDINLSREEFINLGLSYNYPHMTDPKLLDIYLGGYREADLVICPSQVSAQIMKEFGCQNITIIPHGTNIPNKKTSAPQRFQVGYLGQPGPDKGLRYLFEAWKMVNLQDSTLLLAGKDVPSLLSLARIIGGGNMEFMGFVDEISQLYNRCAVYCQPSVTEGFGIEVLEAMAHSRPVIVSDGAGAADAITDGVDGFIIPKKDPTALAKKIHWCYTHRDELAEMGSLARQKVTKLYSWDIIRKQYQTTWKNIK